MIVHPNVNQTTNIEFIQGLPPTYKAYTNDITAFLNRKCLFFVSFAFSFTYRSKIHILIH